MPSLSQIPPDAVVRTVRTAIRSVEADGGLPSPFADPLLEGGLSKADEERIRQIIRAELKEKSTDERVALIAKRCIIQFAKALWTRRSAWTDMVNGRTTESLEEGTRRGVDLEALRKVAGSIRRSGDYGHLWFNGATQSVHWTMGDADGEPEYTDAEEIERRFREVPGVTGVEIGDEWSPEEKDGWERVEYRDEIGEGRDDIGTLPIPSSGKRYARMKGLKGLRHKFKLWTDMVADLTNEPRGGGFVNRDAGRRTAGQRLADKKLKGAS